MKKYIILLLLFIWSCNLSNKNKDVVKSIQNLESEVLTGIDSMHIREYVEKSFQTPLHSLEHQQYLDSALTIDPANAWLWQQKAMPLYKARKYQLGRPFLEKAVEHNPEKYLDYDKKIISLYPYLRDYYNYILSNELSVFINKLVNEKLNFECHSIACSSAWPKSFLAPHIDTISIDNDINKTLNCIHFIDGNNDDVEFSGATGIYEDNEFKKKIFIPKSLKNSLLIYNSKKNFYHGFDIMKKKNYRKSVMFQFFKKD